MSQPKTVLVEWIDACSNDNWGERSNKARVEPIPVLSVGHLISRDKHALVIAQSFSPETDKVSCTLTIPIGCIQKIRPYVVKPKRKRR